MAVERRMQLPVGRYWIAYPPDQATAFIRWWNASRPNVGIERTSRDPKTGWETVVFLVKAPVPDFPQVELGFPNVAGADVKTTGDTIQVPIVDEPGLLEAVSGGARSFLAMVPWLLGLAALLLLPQKGKRPGA
jgi:hypothetical protein